MEKYYKYLKFLVFAYLILFVFSLIYRIPHLDDAWLGEHAYWQSKLGYVKSELMHGFYLQEIRLLLHHKLFTLQGAFLINHFGFSLYVLKSISLFYCILFLIIIYLVCFKNKEYHNLFRLYILLFISNVFVFNLSFVYRPEITTMTIGFISYIFLERALQKQDYKLAWIIASGLFSGLAVAVHLNGLIFPIAGFTILLLNRKYYYSLIFLLSVVPAFSIYFYDFTHEYNFKWWAYQFKDPSSPNRLNNLSLVYYYLENLFTEHLRFLHSPKEISFTLFLIAVFSIAYKQLREYKLLITYTLVLIISLAVLAMHKTSYYMVLYLPFLLFLSILSVYKIWKSGISELPVFNKYKSIKNKDLIFILFSIYFIINTFYNVQLTLKKHDPDKNRNLVKQYLPIETKDCNIVAPMEFIFDEIGNFKMIQSNTCYDDFKKIGINTNKENFLKTADQFGIDYIIVNEGYIKIFELDKLTKSDFRLNNYSILFTSKQLLLLKKEY